MDPFCNEDDIAIVDAIRRYAEAEIAPKAQAIDEDETFAGVHWGGLAEMGLTGMNLPEIWGGPGTSAVALYLAIEALAESCGSTTSMLTAHYLASDSILLGGTDDQRGRWLPGAADGSFLGAFGLTEPKAGSNPMDMRTRARRDGDHYILSGTKHFISNAAHADFVIVFCVTDPDAGAHGISALVVERKAIEGITVSSHEPTMGIRGGHVFEIAFDDCRIPADCLLGEEGMGFKTAMKVLDNGRLEVAATATGIARAALAAARQWMLEREVSGKPIARYQGLQWMFADMATDLQASRLLGLHAASLRETGIRFSQEAAMAKLAASEMVNRVTDKALQIHGGYGYSRHMPLERYARDARILRIYEGSSEIQRNIIARTLLR